MKRLALLSVGVAVLLVGMTLSAHGAPNTEGASAPVMEAPAPVLADSGAHADVVSAHELSPAVLAAPSAADTLPVFLADEESARVQQAQMALYLKYTPLNVAWTSHIAPQVGHEPSGLAGEPPYTPAELEEFRGLLLTFAVDLQALVDYFPDEQVLDEVARLQAVEGLVPDLTHEELAALRYAFSEYPGFWNTPTYMLNKMQLDPDSPDALPPYIPQDEPVIDARPTVPFQPSPQYSGCLLFAYGGTCDMCPPAAVGGVATVFAAETAAFIVESSCQFIPPDLLAGSTSVPNPANVICVGIRAGLEIFAAAVKLMYDLNAECEDNFARNIVHWYLDETVSSRASQQSHDYHNLTELRLSMEHDLLNLLDDRVSTFQMPEIHGGYINAQDNVSVRWVVEDTIKMQERAGYTGEEIRNAKDEYEAAEEHLNDEEWKSAYARYRKAYRAAVRPGRER